MAADIAIEREIGQDDDAAAHASPEQPEVETANAGTSNEFIEPSANTAIFTRRQALALGAVAAAPPLAAAAVTQWATAELGTFRIRRVELTIPSLPADLDGLTIAQVSDLHLGKFVSEALATRAADAANALAADLVVFTGDLIDIGDMSRLPAGLAFLRRLDRRHGLAIIEGNHDIMAYAEQFEADVRSAGLPLLLDESVVYRVPGRPTPVQFMGITWGAWTTGDDLGFGGESAERRFRKYKPESTQASIQSVLAQRDPGAFPILLAHHPHAFDPASSAGLPLTLAGHTHGGQLMLTDHLGVGPVRFRYWSGAYEMGDHRLFISNGVGAWFPLRVNAPADIAHITLRTPQAKA